MQIVGLSDDDQLRALKRELRLSDERIAVLSPAEVVRLLNDHGAQPPESGTR